MFNLFRKKEPKNYEGKLVVLEIVDEIRQSYYGPQVQRSHFVERRIEKQTNELFKVDGNWIPRNYFVIGGCVVAVLGVMVAF